MKPIPHIKRKDGTFSNGCHVNIEDFITPISPVSPIDLDEIRTVINYIVGDLALIKAQFAIAYPANKSE